MVMDEMIIYLNVLGPLEKMQEFFGIKIATWFQTLSGHGNEFRRGRNQEIQ